MIDIEGINSFVARNISFGFEAGLRVPELAYLKSMSQENSEIFVNDPRWDVYVDEGIAVKIEGHKYHVLAHWDGEDFSFLHTVVNDNSILSGGQGDLIGSNAITIFRNVNGMGAKVLKRIAQRFREEILDYRGFVDITLSVGGKEDFFYGVQFGEEGDYMIALKELYGGWSGEEPFPEKPVCNFVAALKLYAYPYGIDENFAVVSNVPDDLLLGMDVHIGEESYVVTGKGRRVFEAWRALYKSINPAIRLFNVCYKIDGDRMAKEVFKAMKGVSL